MLGFCTAKAIHFSFPLFCLILLQTLLKLTRTHPALNTLLSAVDYYKLNFPDCKFTDSFIQFPIFTLMFLNDIFVITLQSIVILLLIDIFWDNT